MSRWGNNDTSRGQGGIGFVAYQKNDFWLGALCYKIKSKKTDLLDHFIYFYLKAHNDLILQFKKEGGTPAINRRDLKQIQIPLPPLAVQNDIVELLDKFDTLTNDLTSGIPAEIEARKKQYEHYRERLLSFKEQGK